MKILLVGPYNSPIIRRLCAELRCMDHNVLVASYDVASGDGIVGLGKLTGFNDYLKFWKINSLIRDFNPEVIHAHVVNHYGIMCIFNRYPKVLAVWGSDVMLAPNSGSILKRTIFRIINKIVFRSFDRIHCSAEHVIEEANKQSKTVAAKADVFYWGLPIAAPSNKELEQHGQGLTQEFGINGQDLITFPRGLSSIYNPEIASLIIKKLLSMADCERRIVVLKGYSDEAEETNFLAKIPRERIIYINRVLSDIELFWLYSRTAIHFSIPKSDALGGGVIEPALFGSFPILSAIPSYEQYAAKYPSYIIRKFDSETIKYVCECIKYKVFSKSTANVPRDYTGESVLNSMEKIYLKTIAINESKK